MNDTGMTAVIEQKYRSVKEHRDQWIKTTTDGRYRGTKSQQKAQQAIVERAQHRLSIMEELIHEIRTAGYTINTESETAQ